MVQLLQWIFAACKSGELASSGGGRGKNGAVVALVVVDGQSRFPIAFDCFFREVCGIEVIV